MMEAVELSEAERERVIRDLTRHCGDGRLTLDELEERVAEVYAATNAAEAPAGAAPPVFAPASDAAKRARERSNQYEKSLGMACTIGGFVLLFNGMFWLALLCWFVLPGLIIRHRSC